MSTRASIQYNPYDSPMVSGKSLSDYGFGYGGENGFGQAAGASPDSMSLGQISGAAQGAYSLFNMSKSSLDTSHLNDRDLDEAGAIDKNNLDFDTSFHKANLAQIDAIDAGTTNPLEQMLSGVSGGTKVGALGGGVGAGIGAVAGGLIAGATSLFGNHKKRKKAQELRERLTKEANEEVNEYSNSFDQALASNHSRKLADEKLSALMNKYRGVPNSINSLI